MAWPSNKIQFCKINPLQINNCSEFKMRICNLYGVLSYERRNLVKYALKHSMNCCLPKSTSHSFITKFDAAMLMYESRTYFINVDNTMTKWKRSFNLVWFEKTHSIQHDLTHFLCKKGASSATVSYTLFTLLSFKNFHLSHFFHPFYRVFFFLPFHFFSSMWKH